jgi:hypothetical protein
LASEFCLAKFDHQEIDKHRHAGKHARQAMLVILLRCNPYEHFPLISADEHSSDGKKND